MPVPSAEPVHSGPKRRGRLVTSGRFRRAREPKNCNDPKTKQSNQSKDPKTQQSKQTQQTKQTKKRLTKKEQDEAAVQKVLSSPAFNEFLDARVTMEVEKQLDNKRRSGRFDKVYNKAKKVMRQFALLADGDPEVYTDEGDLLLDYMGKMTELQSRRKVMAERAERMAEVNASFSRLKHKRNC